MKKNLLFIVIVAITGMFVFSSCSKGGKTIDAKKQELATLKIQLNEIKDKITNLEKELALSNKTEYSDVVLVDVQNVVPEKFQRFIRVQGTIESDQVASISCKMGGPVTRIFVQEGSMVKRGQLLMQIDDEIVKRGIEELSTSISFAEDVFNRQKRLWEQKAGSEVQYLQAKNTYESLLKKKSSLEQQQDNAKIYAPFSGYVDLIYPKIGETVMPGTPIFKLTGMSNIKVTADISETYITTVKPGISAEISIPELNEVITGKITTAAKAIDSKNRTFKVEIKLNRIPKSLRPFLVCSVSINDVTKDNIITAPIAYLQKSGEEFFVFVADETNGIAKKRDLKTGLFNETSAEIITGLNANEKIITNGSLDVSDGQKIKIINTK